MMLPIIRFRQKIRGTAKFPLIFYTVFIASLDLTAAPRGQYYQDPNANAFYEMRSSLDSVRHEVNNHEVEIRVIDEKLKNFDSIIESVRDQLSDSSKMHKEQLRGSSASFETRINSLEDTSKGLLGDLRLFKVHSNETTTALTQYKQKITELEKIIDKQNQNIEHLQAAMGLLMEALQGKPQGQDKASDGTVSITSSTGRTYKIKSGDSLEKIAKAHQVTIQALKDANGLTKDRIVEGKTLVIPEK